MSQDYHHQAAAAAAAGIFNFSNGYERSQQEEQIIRHQGGRDKVLRGQGFEPPPPLVAMDEEDTGGALHGYDQTAGMLSEMFNFPSGAATATELLQQQISGHYHGHIVRPSHHQHHQDNWYIGNEDKSSHLVNEQQHIGTSINATDSAAAAMQLFLMNPSAARSPSHSPPSTLHMLLPNSNSNSLHQAFHNQTSFGPSPHQQQFTWVPGNTSHDAGSTSTTSQLTPHHHHQIIEGHGQGLSLSLSSSLQHLEAAKAEQFRTASGSGGMLFFNQGGGNSNANQALQLQGTEVVLGGQNHAGFRPSSIGVVNVLRTSKYVKAAQELLDEFCSVGRSQFKKNKFGKPPNPNSNPTGGASSSSSKDLPSLSASDRIEHQRRKVKLLSMLDEVDRRYNHYCEQMQMVVNSFDIVMGYGAAVPYTALAQKAMSRHFRCLKDAIAAQVKHSCELLGEKDAAGTSGVTKGETPRLKLLEQSLRQQRAFHQMGGMLEQEAWRPQRGLPERSVNILRAWLFEHFLHPYPSDADKHLLARQTGLSRNQVSNWFINARVRLWKPMVEDMYQQESKEEGDDDMETNAQTAMPSSTTIASTTPSATTVIRSEINAPESDPSILAINTNFSENQPSNHLYSSTTPLSTVTSRRGEPDYINAADDNSNNIGSTLISFGANTTGDVSLTLGLRHVGNMPEKNPFSVRDFGGC